MEPDIQDQDQEEVSVPNYTIGAITCKNPATEEAITVNFDFGDTLQATIDKYGEEVVHYHVCKKFATSMRNRLYAIFAQADEPISAEEAITEMNNWRPKVTQGRAKKSLTDTALDAYAKMSPEARETFMADILQAQQDED